MVAGIAGNADAIKALISKGARVNQRGANSSTALMYAAASGHEEAVKVLLEENADASIKSTKGKTAEQLAIRRHHPTIAALLKSAAIKHNPLQPQP